MPYLSKEVKQFLSEADRHPGRVSGELNYRITQLLIQYWKYHGPSYQAINDILGALEGAKQEFYHRIASPYEYDKRMTNGDVYD